MVHCQKQEKRFGEQFPISVTSILRARNVALAPPHDIGRVVESRLLALGFMAILLVVVLVDTTKVD